MPRIRATSFILEKVEPSTCASTCSAWFAAPPCKNPPLQFVLGFPYKGELLTVTRPDKAKPLIVFEGRAHIRSRLHQQAMVFSLRELSRNRKLPANCNRELATYVICVRWERCVCPRLHVFSQLVIKSRVLFHFEQIVDLVPMCMMAAVQHKFIARKDPWL